MYENLVKRLRRSSMCLTCQQCQKDIMNKAADAITQLSILVKQLQIELEAERNKHIKIQYKNEELSINEICNRLKYAESKLHKTLNNSKESIK